MVAKNVIKQLATAEDLAHGVGTVEQLRDGEVYTLHRLDIPLGIATAAELASVDPTKYPRVRAGSVQYDYVNGTWQEAVDIRPYSFVPGVTLTETNRYVIQGNTIARYKGVTPYIISSTDDISNTGKWDILAGGGGGGGVDPTPTSGGIIYSNTLPAVIKPEDTYANFETMELVYSFADVDSSQYLAIPMYGGGASGASAGGSGGYSTFNTADPTNSLVALGSTNQDHRIKGLLPGTNVTFDVTGSAITINATGGGGSGNGIVYSNSLPATLVPGTTYANFETMELVFTFNDGNTTQYLPIPMVGSGAAAVNGGSGGGGSFTAINNAGPDTDGSPLMFTAVDTYYFRRLKASDAANIAITASGNSVILEPTIYANAGTVGATLLKAKVGNTIGVKRLVQGANITLTEAADGITIAASGGGGAALGDALTRINTLTPENNNVMVWTAAGVSQFITTAATRAMMGLGPVANTIPMFTGPSGATLATLTPFMVSILAATGKPSALSGLGVTSGSNANGGWLRIATGGDAGVQICWNTIVCDSTNAALGGGFVGPQKTWTYPQAFNGTPSVSGTVQDGINAWVSCGPSGNSQSAATFRQLSFINSSGNAAVSVIAIGIY